jgi:nitroimidazol reductase NimA-like FMN-containing flavoprotein (pyridoxamine 5'-phosphate oxidase superfamily)
MSDRTIDELEEAECLRLIAQGGIGRIAYQSRFGPVVLPVNYKWHDGAVVFRTAQHSAMDEDLRTGIAGGDYKVAFEIAEADRTAAVEAGVEPWPGGEKELFVRIVPSRVTGRRIRPTL